MAVNIGEGVEGVERIYSQCCWLLVLSQMCWTVPDTYLSDFGRDTKMRQIEELLIYPIVNEKLHSRSSVSVVS